MLLHITGCLLTDVHNPLLRVRAFTHSLSHTHTVPNAYAYREQFPLPEKPGYRMYVDPTTYTSTDDALQEFAEEIPPKSIRLEEEIGAGEEDEGRGRGRGS